MNHVTRPAPRTPFIARAGRCKCGLSFERTLPPGGDRDAARFQLVALRDEHERTCRAVARAGAPLTSSPFLAWGSAKLAEASANAKPGAFRKREDVAVARAVLPALVKRGEVKAAMTLAKAGWRAPAAKR